MAFTNRIKVEATGGVGNITLGLPIESFVAFKDGQTRYTILAENNLWEVGVGTISGNTLDRNSVEENSSGDTAKIDFTGQALQVAQTLTGEWAENHLHVESNITDLDKYTQAETDALLNVKKDDFTESTAFNKDFGATSGTVTEGDDSRLHVHANSAVLDATTASFTTADETKLDGIDDSANNYTHPANHPPAIITQDANNRFVTDAQITDWDGKEDGLPAVTNTNTYLKSHEDGTRSWDLPVAKHSDQTDYALNDIVANVGSLYKCINAHSAKAFDLTDWQTSTQPIGSGTEFKYTWTTGLTGDPSNGSVGLNNATPSAASQMRVSKTTSFGNDVSVFIESWNLEDYVGFEEQEGNYEATFFQINGPVVDNGAYYTVNVVYVGGSGVPEDGRDGIVSYVINPSNRIDLGGLTGQSLVKASDNNYDTEWAQRLANIVEDPSPQLGEALETLGHNIQITDAVGEITGLVGESSSGIAFVYTGPDGIYEETDGGVNLVPGIVELHGTTTVVKALEGTTSRQVYCSPDGNLYPVEPPAQGWVATDTSADTTGLGNGNTEGPWIEIADLIVNPVADVADGSRLDLLIGLYVENTANDTGTLNVGIGKNHVDPTFVGASLSVAGKTKAMLQFSFISTTHGGLLTSDDLTVYIQRGVSDKNGNLNLRGTERAHDFTVSVPEGSGGTLLSAKSFHSQQDLAVLDINTTPQTVCVLNTPELPAGTYIIRYAFEVGFNGTKDKPVYFKMTGMDFPDANSFSIVSPTYGDHENKSHCYSKAWAGGAMNLALSMWKDSGIAQLDCDYVDIMVERVA